MDLMAISDGEWLILGDAPNFLLGCHQQMVI
jgi:hypothetical protein